jgi:hypothetical protein
LIITRKTEDVSRELTRTIRALKSLGEMVAPLIQEVVGSTERPWWDLFTAEGLATLIARLESMKSLCDNYGATEVQVSHEDMYHITGATALVERINKGLGEIAGDSD